MLSERIEFHVHTKAGSPDASLTADQLGQLASAAGIRGVLVAEHFRVWSDWEREAFFERWGVRTYRAMEATTSAGHIVVIGAREGFIPPRDGVELLKVVRREGWFSILAHPFRHYFDMMIHSSQRPAFAEGATPEQLAEAPIWELVDAIEVENAVNTDRENALALQVASITGHPVSIGADTHHDFEFGRLTLPVPAIPADERELIDLVTALKLTDLVAPLGWASEGGG